MSWDKIGNDQYLLDWKDVMETEEYDYTAGVAGEEFLKGLSEKKIIGAKCPKCNTIYVPARLYCENCFEKTEFVEVKTKPYLDTYTIIYKDNQGNKLEKPQIIGLVRFENTKGGLLAVIEGEEKEEERKLSIPSLNLGSEVEILRYEIPLVVRLK
ncbi:DNA-binding protein [Acidianus sulfidivorans JP7]|uniref:DNA-binding protein n=1 Tax=Acidianus sulfidivorans JP7 TaxID=619593 RepID=A0A2U9IJX3_9CREN|nr:Zn-ribbon domain-containing OB-fold protein [Acidianus sulfidivorans]AWR96266.1 DNA-binding protein [Acidianus sulfidivorans JP7]